MTFLSPLFDCCKNSLEICRVIKSRPPGETEFGIKPQKYIRSYERCSTCGHFYSEHQIDLSLLYSGQYVTSTYGDLNGLRARFNRIVNLPTSESDNQNRVKRIVNNFPQNPHSSNLLDVGGGLGVFGYEMKKYGFNTYVTEQDQLQVMHMRELGLNAVYSISDLQIPKKFFNLLTFNKVLEHVEEPIKVLTEHLCYLQSGGYVYLEVPDGTSAFKYSPNQVTEEFYIEHLHVFSLQSLINLNYSCGLALLNYSSILEPSGKFTVWSIAMKL